MKDAEYVEGQIVERNSTVEYFHENPQGDVDGIYLGDGSEIRFPPHLGKHFFNSLHFGQEVAIRATAHITKHGDLHLHAHHILDIHNGTVLLEKEPHVHKSKKLKEDRHSGDRFTQEVVEELRAIRQLLESQLNRP